MISTLLSLIARDRSTADAERFRHYRLVDPTPVMEFGRQLLDNTPVLHGACAGMSAMWAAGLTDRYNIPAVVVAGDLIINGRPAFLSQCNLPDGTEQVDSGTWNGHCWVQADDMICDASIFRTARTRPDGSHLKAFIDEHFGLHRGLMVCSATELARGGMHYVPKYVLNETQITGLIRGLHHQIKTWQ